MNILADNLLMQGFFVFFFCIQNRKMNLSKKFSYRNFVTFFALLGKTSPLKSFSLPSTKNLALKHQSPLTF